MVGHVKHSIWFYLNKKKMLKKYIGQKYFNLAHKEDFYKSNYVPKIYYLYDSKFSFNDSQQKIILFMNN